MQVLTQALLDTPGVQPAATGADGGDRALPPPDGPRPERPSPPQLPGQLAEPPLARPISGPLAALIARLPKAELHVHVEGTLEPELMLALAARNGVALPYADAAAAAAARSRFAGLQDFLDCYNNGMAALLSNQDFYELADAYLARAAAEGVRHVELFFVPQGHTSRGVPWVQFFPGLAEAVEGAPARHGLTAALILCFMRDLGPEAAMQTLEQALPYRSQILGVGLESAERGFPPGPFAAVFERAASLGWRRVAHAGEEGGPENIWACVRELGVERVDHGVRCLEDPQLVEHLEASQVPLTVCPLSNLCLQVYAGCLEDRLRALVLGTRLALTVNSDDPAYFGGYVCANFAYLARVAGLGPRQLADLAAASFRASFIEPEAKQRHVEEVQQVLDAWLAETGVQADGCCKAEGDGQASAAPPTAPLACTPE